MTDRNDTVSPSSSGDHIDTLVRALQEQGIHLDWPTFRLSMQLTRLAGLHTQRADRDIRREHQLTWSGFNVLLIVWLFGPIEAHEIAKISGVTRQSTSSGLATLEKLGLVTRRRSALDRRRVDVSLSSAGEERVRHVLTRRNAEEVGWYGDLDAQEKERLVELLVAAEKTLTEQD